MKSDLLRLFPIAQKWTKVVPFRYTPLCVYFLLDRNEVVYVGQSHWLEYRVEEHRRGARSTSRKEFNGVYYIPIKEELIDAAEMAFIKFFRAKYNKQWRTGSWIKYRRGMEPLGKPYTDTEIAVLRTLILL
ncbi:GIY-YIG nuclease family protein [Agrobacterium tumefaciens]|uniref:GIY-YIG nuclease family protein n=1 Tax=Agrobacterium tumefaciens TaxID=358 RepID=UPI001573A498|nr:GIY-YIG nuclease family protein [Agrobacterium tumefaciens]